MSAVRELIAALVAGGMDAIDAAALVARAGSELVSPKKTAGAERQQRYRDRNKASRNVTPLRCAEASRNVTKRNESVTSDALSLSLTSSSEVIQKKEGKRESRASALPDGWRPPEQAWTAAIASLGSLLRAEQELTKFRNHALDKGRVSKRWGAAWANWVERAIVYAGGVGNAPHQPKLGSVSAAFREIREQLEGETGRGSAAGGNPVLRLSSG